MLMNILSTLHTYNPRNRKLAQRSSNGVSDNITDEYTGRLFTAKFFQNHDSLAKFLFLYDNDDLVIKDHFDDTFFFPTYRCDPIKIPNICKNPKLLN